MNETDAQAKLATAAVDLEAMRGHMAHLRDDLDAGDEWPAEMDNGEVAPTLAYQIVSNVTMLLEEYVEPGIELVRRTAGLTAEGLRRDWEANRSQTLATELYSALSKMSAGAHAAVTVFESAQSRLDDGEAVDVKEIRRTVAALTRQASALASCAAELVPAMEDEGSGEDGP